MIPTMSSGANSGAHSNAHFGASTGRNQVQMQHKQSNTLTLRQILSSNTSARDLENTANTQDEIAAIQSLYLNLDNNKNNKENCNKNNIMTDEADIENQARVDEIAEYYKANKNREEEEKQQRAE